MSSNLTQAAGEQNTTNATSTSSNTTQAAAAPGPLAALTQSDFDELTSNLNSARGAIRANDSAGVIDDLGSAETELRTFMTQVGGENSTGGQQLSAVLDHIDMAQDASSSSNDTLKAFQEINTADTDLLKIIQKLPADGDESD